MNVFYTGTGENLVLTDGNRGRWETILSDRSIGNPVRLREHATFKSGFEKNVDAEKTTCYHELVHQIALSKGMNVHRRFMQALAGISESVFTGDAGEPNGYCANTCSIIRIHHSHWLR